MYEYSSSTSFNAQYFDLKNMLCLPVETNHLLEPQEEELTIDQPVDNSNVRINRQEQNSYD